MKDSAVQCPPESFLEPLLRDDSGNSSAGRAAKPGPVNFVPDWNSHQSVTNETKKSLTCALVIAWLFVSWVGVFGVCASND